MPIPIHLGISTCPNDTFAFHAIMTGRIDTLDLDFRINLCDVQELNTRTSYGEFDVAKVSFFLAAKYSKKLQVIPAGAALGFGVGPLLLARDAGLVPVNDHSEWQDQRGPLVLCPGADTTAHLLYRMFYPGVGRVKQLIFSQIMPALRRAEADFGVCIHEGRFTWEQQNLFLVEDLGQRWEQDTGMPLPLGGIVARRSLPADVRTRVHQVIYDSIDYGLQHRQETLESMRKYAQEMDDEVLFAHVDLYVNEWTIDLGDVGRRALQTFSQRAIECGAVDRGQPGLEILT